MYLVYIAVGLATIALAICIYILINNNKHYAWLENFLTHKVLLRLPPPGPGPGPESRPLPEGAKQPKDASGPQILEDVPVTQAPQAPPADDVSLVSASLTPETLKEFNLA